jgi:hypothetical protein
VRPNALPTTTPGRGMLRSMCVLRALCLSVLLLGACALAACHSRTSQTTTESTMAVGAGSGGPRSAAEERADAPIFAEICVPTSLRPGRYVLRVSGAEALPRPLRELRVRKGCVHPLAVPVCPNELGVEQEGSVLRVASERKKQCYEATVAEFRIGDAGIHARVTFESKCGKASRLVAEGDLTRAGP